MNTDPMRQQILDLVERYGEASRATAAFQAGVTPIPAAGKVIGGIEMRQMVDAVLDGWLTSGRFNTEFERRLGQFLGRARAHHQLGLFGQPAGVHRAHLAEPGRARHQGRRRSHHRRRRLSDDHQSDPAEWLRAGFRRRFAADLQHRRGQIEAAISSRTRAIMLAHTLGNPFDLAEVCRIARKHGLWLIEDCCDALGSTYDGRPVGTFGDIGTLSFYPAHHITMGEGGAVFTRDPQLKRILESLRDWGRDCYCATGCDNTCGKRFAQQHGDLPFGYDHKYTYSQLGYNLKITDVQAACALAQSTACRTSSPPEKGTSNG
jgi:CDP-6-deoxy-D-xylo-4-hexulose-3-dehydrase